jgi:hypothetical protein
LVTRRLQVREGVVPSSKNDRGIVAVVGRLYVVLVNEVAAAILGVPAVRVPLGNVSVLRRAGGAPLMESIDAEGDRVALKEVRLLRGT